MIYEAYGGPEKLTLVDAPRPVPTEGQVLVRVLAGSVNPIDWKRASGALRMILPLCFPGRPGYDVAGEIVELGPGVTGLAVGDRVHARIGESNAGGAAEYAVVGVDVIAPIPSVFSAAEAAALPLAGMTALQGLRDQAGLPLTGATERVLVVGASGGVGHLAVQIARAAGATVIGVCSGRNAELVRSLGAHEVIDYTKPDAFQGLAPVDIVLDCVGGDASPWTPLLGPGGRYASCVPGPAVFLRSAVNALTDKQVKPVLLKSRAADLRILGELAERGALRVVIDSHFPLSELGAAWTRSMSGRTVGKIVIDVASEPA